MNLDILDMSVIQSNAGKPIYHQGAPRHGHGPCHASGEPGKKRQTNSDYHSSVK